MSDESRLKGWDQIKHFAPSEFDSPDLPGSGILMNLDFIIVLDKIRKDVGFPLNVSSGYRTIAHNSKVSRIEKSEHTTGNAVDIAVSNGLERMAIVESALQHGISRIGIANTFIHLGYSLDLPQNVIWTY